MTRPQIIRADTLDLQDTSSPTAQDHSRQPAHPSPLGIGPAAPHQAAALHQVVEERATEEEQLEKAWNGSARDEPPSEEEDDDEHINGDSSYDQQQQQRDEQAIQQNGGYTGQGEDQDMADAESDDNLDDDMMDKISSSPSIDDEDIDFEFVYALHTFVATVEGQANATKGDTMVLLDDSNSYWWLVRIVKDSSIGYLPAEHIETPTERLARLNKHRNIDLSATMLGDTAEKTKNPLKKAIRRRNARTVQFSATPTYREASDYEYSSDEEDEDEEQELMNGGEVQAQEQSAVVDSIDEDAAPVETATNGNKRDAEDDNGEVDLESRADEVESRKVTADQPRPSEESLIDKQFGPSKSRNGTVRNTDSFFRDETIETRKITLTPGLLRDDSSQATTLRTSESRERGSSFDSLEGRSLKSESNKEDKKRKEKKPGMFSGLFKKKDKKSRADDTETEKEKTSGDYSPKVSEDAQSSPLSPTNGVFPQNALGQPQRTGSRSKLQKHKPGSDGSSLLSHSQSNEQLAAPRDRSPQNEVATVETGMVNGVSPQATQDAPVEKPPSLRIKTQDRASEGLSNLTHKLRPGSSDGGPKREKVKKAKQRIELDDFDESPDEVERPSRQGQHQREQERTNEPAERLSESPVQVSPLENVDSLDTEESSDKPAGALAGDESSTEDRAVSPPTSPDDFEDLRPEPQQQQTSDARQPRQAPPEMRDLRALRNEELRGPAFPAPLHVTKQQQQPQQQQRSTSAEPQEYIPPPTRAAPVPGSSPISSSALAKQTSASTLNTSYAVQQQQQPPGLSSSPTASSDSSTTPTGAPSTARGGAVQQHIPQSARTPSASTNSPAPPPPAWNDAALRAFIDDPSHARDLLLIVHDTNGLPPLGPDDPEVRAMFAEPRRRLKELERELDGMLMGWLERKRGAVGGKGAKGTKGGGVAGVRV